MSPAVQSLLHQSLPLPVVAVLVLQTAGFVWVGSNQLTEINMRISVIEKAIEAQFGQKDRIIILEQGMNVIKEDLQYIKTMLRDQSKAKP